jgi:hypothetical protein
LLSSGAVPSQRERDDSELSEGDVEVRGTIRDTLLELSECAAELKDVAVNGHSDPYAVFEKIATAVTGLINRQIY